MHQGKKGFFITLEGIDGTGKTTQAKLLAKNLKKRGFPVLLTREPGGTLLAERIRAILLELGEEKPVPLAELLLYGAARAQHVMKIIAPALAAGTVVICERFSDSTLAYQGYGLGLDLEMITEINRIAAGGLAPDLTLLLHLETEEICRRIRQRDPESSGDRIEARGRAFLEKVQEGYLQLAEAAPERIKVIRCQGKQIQEIQEFLLAACFAKLGEGGGNG
ncbi:MAG: dTMP kinase [Firmicutes bacterium]|nr:dTMP kinase [Bacillota bacterium]